MYYIHIHSKYPIPLIAWYDVDPLCDASSLVQEAESRSGLSQSISAREHFVFTDTDGQVYHLTVEGNSVKDGARIPPDVSVLAFQLPLRLLNKCARRSCSALHYILRNFQIALIKKTSAGVIYWSTY